MSAEVKFVAPFMGVSNRKGQGITVKDVPAADFVAAYAKHLKEQGKLVAPAFAEYCKTAACKELAPVNPDWFYIRAASLARHLYLRPAGLGALRKVYGCKQRVASRPCRAALASTNILRKILQQLETLKLVEKCPRKGGRCLSAQGRKELDTIAVKVLREIKNRPVNC